MTLVRFNTRPIYNSMLDQILWGQPSNATNCEAAANIFNTDSAFIIEMLVPGYAKEDIRIQLEQQMLKISAEAPKSEIAEDRFMRREFTMNGINRSFSLPRTINTDAIAADFKNGILTITLPRKEEDIVKKQITIS